MEGDTPSFLYVLPNGLNEPENPGLGGWGGYFTWGTGPDNATRAYAERDPSKKHWYDGPGAKSVSKWLPEIQKDFATRMDWCVIRD